MRPGPSNARCDRVKRELLGRTRYDTEAYGEASHAREGGPKGQFSVELFDEWDVPRMEENVLPPATDPAVQECGNS